MSLALEATDLHYQYPDGTVALRGVRTTGPLAPEIDLSKQRPAQYVFAEQVQKKLSDIRHDEAVAAQQKADKLAQPRASTAA